MTTDESNKQPPCQTYHAPRVLAFAMLAVTLLCLAGMVTLAGTACSALFGVGSSDSLFEFVLAGGSALAFAVLGAVIAVSYTHLTLPTSDLV